MLQTVPDKSDLPTGHWLVQAKADVTRNLAEYAAADNRNIHIRLSEFAIPHFCTPWPEDLSSPCRDIVSNAVGGQVE